MAPYTSRTTIVLVLLLGATLAPSPESAGATPPNPPIFITAADQTSYAWAADLFTDKGFDLPSVAIEFHADEEGCGGMRGRTHLAAEGEAAFIHVCATHDRLWIEETWRRRTLLHELAHAWIDQNVNETVTAAFVELRAVDTWLARDHLWQDRGAEHAAEIFMWGVQDGDYTLDFRLDDTECSEVSAAYTLLTGDVVACDQAS